MESIELHKDISSNFKVLIDQAKTLIGKNSKLREAKSVVLKQFLKERSPEKFSIGKGFVQSVNDSGQFISKYMDFIIYDNSSPLMFLDDNFVIISAKAVKGIIEVRENINYNDLLSTIEIANENGKFIYDGLRDDQKDIKFFNAIFSYETSEKEFDSKVLNNHISKIIYNSFHINCLVLNSDVLIKYQNNEDRFCLYELKDFAYSWVILNN